MAEISNKRGETTRLVTTLNTWKKDRRFFVSRILKDEKDSAQLHLFGRK
jgi:hypothetical protein